MTNSIAPLKRALLLSKAITPAPLTVDQQAVIAFLVGSKLIVMCEHQSSVNPNIPLRFLFYISDILRTYALNTDSLYRRALVQIPTPEFFILYNGKQKTENQRMILSDAFLLKESLLMKYRILSVYPKQNCNK